MTSSRVPHRRPRVPSSPLGRLAEEICARHLERDGYEIVARNYRGTAGEIDIVASRDGVLAFVEVKGRRSIGHGIPAAAVDRRKQERYRRTALEYLAELERGYNTIRFDVFSVVLLDGHGQPILEHIRGAF